MKKRKVFGTTERPRLSVFRSLSNLSAQLIDDESGKTLLAVTSIGKKNKLAGKKIEVAKTLGKTLAAKALAAGIKKVVFDRGHFLYHGRVKALADAAREGGLQF